MSIPQTFPGRAVDPGFIRKNLARAEAQGFHSAWIVEQIVGAIPGVEPIDGLAQVAAAGAGMLMLNPLFEEIEQLEIFASEIAPRL